MLLLHFVVEEQNIGLISITAPGTSKDDMLNTDFKGYGRPMLLKAQLLWPRYFEMPEK